MKKVSKYIEYFTTKIRVLLQQHIFEFNGIKVKYLFKSQPKSNDLVIIFSAFTRKGLKARYNYVRTLKDFPCNQLFILDDFGEDGRGGYYIGYKMNFKEEVATKVLIQKMMIQTNANRVIFCGSSKGGWAALNFGLQFNNSCIIAGGPQYYLATYLINDGNENTLRHIMGEKTPEKIKFLDQYLKNRIINCSSCMKPEIYLHYSNQEHTYKEHIQDMINDLEEYNFQIHNDICVYENHSDISLYFPDFLARTIQGLLSRDVAITEVRESEC